MKIKNKGKVYPSPSPAFSPESDAFSVFKLLPAAILAIASLLSLDDREVLAYLITRSLKTTTITTTTTTDHSAAVQEAKRKSSKNPARNTAEKAHKPPMFECECFSCYTNYWFRWDSSPNRELINQAIDAFEDHLANGEKLKKTTRGKRRDKANRRVEPNENPLNLAVPASPDPPVPVKEVSPTLLDCPETISDDTGERVEDEEVIGELLVAAAETVAEPETEIVMATSSHKGLARKVLPDVFGLFNSRLWSLWSPNAQ